MYVCMHVFEFHSQLLFSSVCMCVCVCVFVCVSICVCVFFKHGLDLSMKIFLLFKVMCNR